MAVPRLDEVVMELLLFVHAVTGYAVPGERPSIAQIPQSYLARAACDRPCDVYGWYPYGRTIYLDSRLDPVRDGRARGILLHELVHYVQHASHAFEDDDPCVNWRNREYQAYRVQARWLSEHGVVDPAVSGVGRAPWAAVGCTAAGKSGDPPSGTPRRQGDDPAEDDARK